MVSTQLGGIEDTRDFVLGMGLALPERSGWAVGVLMTKSCSRATRTSTCSGSPPPST